MSSEVPENDIYLMDPDDDGLRLAGIRMDHLIFIFCGLGLILFIIYLMWNSQCSVDKSESEETKEIVKPSPIFAYELEPGIVVMQSKDGEFFRILHEYDSSTRGTKNYGSSSSSQYIQMDPSPVHYIPHYTRPVLQTQPSAPLSPDLMDIGPSGSEQPPPYHTSMRR
ncbi:hypothetical protein SNE40_007095 [Patella caerulea]|uniref:Uncharacterized protein n=1 Tax=Patella caerulea TaxID=87958 RepID=A0AAN8JVW6_PATCE